MAKLLIVEDDPSLNEMLELHFQEQGHHTLCCHNCAESLRLIKAHRPDLVLLDQQLPDGLGSTLISDILSINPRTRIIMMTGVHDLELAIQAIQDGAADFIHKPVKTQSLQQAVDKALAFVPATEAAAPSPPNIRELIGRSDAMLEVSKKIALSAQNNATVLITGESGTGKEIVARLIHQYSRRSGPLVAINCAAIVDSLLEAELFGHEKGAFTGATQSRPGRFQQARGGTLFLDEIAELVPRMQAKLLRALQEQVVQPIGALEPVPVDARIIAATHRNLFEEVRAGRFREDLAYRLDVIHIELPPLRERREDIPLLTQALLERAARKMNCALAPVSDAAMETLTQRDWPGNVRELENTLIQALIQARDGIIDADLVRCAHQTPTAGTYNRQPPSLTLAQMEAGYIQDVLHYTKGHKTKTCAILGISRPALDRKIKKYGLTIP